MILYRVDPGEYHLKGYITYAYILDTGMLMLIVNQAIVPVYKSFTNLENPGRHMSLARVLRTPALLECLESFLRREFAVENLRFVIETQKWKQYQPGPGSSAEVMNEWRAVAVDIFNTFVHHNALLEVNLKAETKGTLVKLFEGQTHKKTRKYRHGLNEAGGDIDRDHGPKNLKPDTFDEAADEIRHLLELDSFPRFLASAEYKAKVYEDFYGTTQNKSAGFGTVGSTASGGRDSLGSNSMLVHQKSSSEVNLMLDNPKYDAFGSFRV
jgi:hypothetical protein